MNVQPMPEWYRIEEVPEAPSNKWWFGPKATASVTRSFFERKNRSGRGWFIFGGIVFWILFFYLIAALVILQVALWAAIVLLIWAAQIVVAITYGLPVLIIRAIRR